MMASFPHLGDLPSGGMEHELASGVQRDVARALGVLSWWNLRLPTDLEVGDVATLAHLPANWTAAGPFTPDVATGHMLVDRALYHLGFVHSGRLPPVQKAPEANSAPGSQSSNPLTFVTTGGAATASPITGDSPDLANLPPHLEPLVPAIRTLVPVLAALRQQQLAGTLTAFGERLLAEVAVAVGACRALVAAILLLSAPTGHTSDTPVASVLPGGIDALRALVAWPGTPSDTGQDGEGVDASTTLLSLHLQLRQALLSAKEACPWLVSTPLAVPGSAHRILACCPGARWCGAAPPPQGTTISGGVVVLSNRPSLAALPSEGGAAAPFPPNADADQADGAAGSHGGDDWAQAALQGLAQVLPLLRMALLVAVRGLHGPVAGFDFLRAEIVATAPGSKALWVDTQAITQAAGLPASNPPSCSDAQEGPLTGAGCRAADAGLGNMCAWVFDWAPCVAWPATCLSCLACHCCCCRPLGRRARRRLPASSTRRLPSPQQQHVLEGLKGPDGWVDGSTYISAVWLPAPNAVGADGAVQRRSVVLLCEPNMGMWCLHLRFGDVVAELHTRGMHVLAWDYRGYGLSDGLPSPAKCRLDVTALKHVLRSHPSLAPAVGKVVVHGTSIGGLAAVEAAMPLPPSAPGNDGEAALAILDRNFASLPLTAERMVAWWAGTGMQLLLPRWGLDNAAMYLAAPVPRVCLADPAKDTIIAWRASLAASVATTVAADALPTVLARCDPRHQAALVAWLQERRQALHQHLGRASMLPCAVAGPVALAQARRGTSTACLPQPGSLPHSSEGEDAPLVDTAQGLTTSILPNQRYHEGTCCNRRGVGGGTAPTSATAPSGSPSPPTMQDVGADGEGERHALLGARAQQPAAPSPLSDFLCVDALSVLGCELAWSWYGVLEWASFAVFHRTATPPLLHFPLYTAPHVPIGSVEVPADGRAFAAEASAGEVPSRTPSLPSPSIGRLSSRLWTSPPAGTAVCNQPLRRRPWVPETYICGAMVKSGCKLLQAFTGTDRFLSPPEEGQQCPAPPSGALPPPQNGLPLPSLHSVVFEEGRADPVRQRLGVIWNAFAEQGLPLGAAGVVNALLHFGRIKAVKEADLLSVLQRGGLDGDTLDPATLGPWLAAGLVWDLGGKAVLPEHEEACQRSVAEAVQAVALAQSLLQHSEHALSSQDAQGAIRALARVTDCLAALCLLSQRMPEVHMHRLQRVNLPSYVTDTKHTRQMMLREGAFMSLAVGHNGPHQHTIQSTLQKLTRECCLLSDT